jgi:ABC-2 type transport system ATP-binding protein
MPILECNNLTKTYAGVTALDHVDLAIDPGRIVGLLGPNGSGKTTLIKLAAGLLQPTQGQILIDGKKPSPETNAVLSYLPERIALSQWMKVTQVLDFFCDFYHDFDRSAAEAMLAQLQIAPNQVLKQMSKGTKEKVQLILAMSRKAKLYLLDEPIGGVDPATRDYILHTILSNYNPEAAVIISTHLIGDVEQILDEVVFLSRGQIALHDSCEAIREQQGKSVDQLFREVFKCWEN